MIYLISDIHGKTEFKGLLQYLERAGKEDLLIVLGDVGLKFGDTEENRVFTEWFLSLGKNIAIVDGNHENFEYLESFPEEDWHGGKVHRLTENIVHLMRGNTFEIQDKNFFVFGGCKSSKVWHELGLYYYGEEPQKEELALAYETIKKNGFEFDYILTHKYEQTPPDATFCPELGELEKYIDENVSYKHWYCGHSHKNSEIDAKHTIVFDELIEL
ncbi:MAG: metallophosphoesterase [Oscillospiraceae bacterium]|nr:metallophosphoesterase [Oscillospiraceae bacterium]